MMKERILKIMKKLADDLAQGMIQGELIVANGGGVYIRTAP